MCSSGAQHAHNERRTWFVVALTIVMMVGEITAGSLFGSMALLADGWHMATPCRRARHCRARLHVRAPARPRRPLQLRHGKFGDLAAFSSAIILGLIAVQIAYESAYRLVYPVPIAFGGGDPGRGTRPRRQSRQRLAARRFPWFMIITAMTTAITTITTTTFAPPMSTCWRTPRLRCWRSQR